MTTPNRSVKVPSVLYRQGGAVVQEDGTIRLSISSDEPYKRFDWWNGEEYWEVLDHTGGGADLTRIVAGTALLYNHDRDVQLGKIQSPEMTDGKCFVKATLSAAKDVEDYRTRITEGILKDCSVGYEIEDQGEDIGEKEGLPVYRFAWTPFEASMVTIPADITVGVGRERDPEKPKGEPREIRIRDKNSLDSLNRETQIRETAGTTKPNSMTPEEKAAADEKERKQRERDEKQAAQDQREQIQEGVKAARERETEIREIAKRADVPEDKKGEFDRSLTNAVESAITKPEAVKDFQDYVFKNFWGKAKPLDTPAAGGGADIRVVGERSRLSIGAQFVASEQFKRAVKGKGQGERCAALDIPISMLGIRGKVAMAQRAGFTSSDLTAVNVAPQQTLVALGVQRLTIMDLIAPGTTSAAAIPYPRENSHGTVNGVAVAAGAMPRATSVGERGVKPTWEPDLTTAIANVKKIAIVSKVPEEFMADFPGMQSYLDERMPFMVDMETEAEILYGDGLGNNLQGVTSTPGIQTRAYAAAWGDTALKALTDIRVGSFFEPDGFVFHPYDWEVARLEKDLNGQYLAGGPYFIPYGNGVFMEMNTFWGKPVVVTTSCAVGRPIAGCWKLGAQYFIREGMRLETTNANEDDFKRNLIAIRAEHRLALAVYRPVAFEEITGGPART